MAFCGYGTSREERTLRKRTVFYIAAFVIFVLGITSPYLAPSFNRACPNTARLYDEFDYRGESQVRNMTVYILANGTITAKQISCFEVSDGQNQKAAMAATGDSYDMSFFFATVPLHVRVYLV